MKIERRHPVVLADPLVRIAASTSAVGFLGFMVWAAFIPLDEGVSANGAIMVEFDRQVVQHLEGGIIARLNVREGEMIEAGAPLIFLQDTAALAQRDQVLQIIASLLASEIRLNALRAGVDPDFSALFVLGADRAAVDGVIERQDRLFRNQVASFEANLSILEARRAGALQVVENKLEQIRSEERVLEALEDQLATTRAMFAQQMARRDQVSELERQFASSQGVIARLRGEQAEAGALAVDLAGQIAQLVAEHEEAISAEVVEVRERLMSAEEELLAAQDALNRSVIPAPQSGEVINMRFSTEGGVIRAGEPILEIVPAETGLIATVRVRPIDRARVAEGQSVRAQLSAYEGWKTPRLIGQVIGISADLKTDDVSGESFYEARIQIPESELARAANVELMPGMPVTAFIFAGTRRTTLEYLFEPISESLFRGLRGG